ncbi:hypothetical protein [Paenarthrobacter nitroguajacolicus]|uniref:hypothetical protein n=1 Tax=Paenarthrobacter nitroguajacolicus TaxID=211146 RepID=UPI003F7533B1
MLWFGIIGLAGNAVGLLVLASGRDLTKVREHFDVSIEYSTFQIEPAAHRDQESIHH